MLSWLFKKGADAPAPPAAAQPAAPARAELKAQQAEDARAQWAPRLQAAQGDDAALLQVVQSAAPLDIRLAAVEALASEDALKQAERELRGHDSRVHKVAKRRWVAAVAQREARTRAQALIDAATALASEALLPANRLVALDRDWQALDAALLSAEQVTEFTALRERLNTVLREQGEQHLREQQEKQQAQQRLAAEAAQREEEAARVAATAEPLEVIVEPIAEAPAAAPQAAAPSLTPSQREHLDALLTQAEAALAEGQLSDMQQHLHALDAALDAAAGAKLSDRLRARHQALHAERARLKGWQQWGGARALDSLVDEAEALAKLTLAAADPEAVQPPKLHVKTHADSIHTLRTRWKEIDRLGAPSNQALWQRFDAALQTAYVPVAAQQAALKAARQENLQAREALLDTLDAVPMGEPPAHAETQAETHAETSAEDAAARWKEPLRALGSFQLAWRQLGPLEHTVPATARSALQQRLRSSVERIEAPIEAARRSAEAVRERLIMRAEALAQELTRNPAARDTVPRVRELQTEWQQHARSLPLARAVEAALWTRFKAATDAVFAQREAAFNARDAELAANLAEREALLARLTTIDLATAPVAEMQRTLGEVERAWRQPVEVPRAAVNALEARFGDARAAVAQAVAESASKRWQAHCETLLAKLALCEQRESGSLEGSDWNALEPLPAVWEKPMAQRWSQPPEAGPLAAPAVDELLLQLEAAFDLPATAEQQTARRDLKLRALKDALEGRAAQPHNPATERAQWFSQALRQSGMTAAQRERLHALVAMLRQSPSAAASLGVKG